MRAQLSTKSTVVAVKTPFSIQQKQQIQKFIGEADLRKIFNNQQNLQMQKCPSAVISNRKMFRPFCQVKICQYRDKQTGQIVQYIQDYVQVNKLYQNIKLCDFYVENNKKQADMNELINLLQAKVLEEPNNSDFKFVAKPTSFLKSFNSTLHNSDLLVNKYHQNKKQYKSQHINFYEQIPKTIQLIPNYVTNHKIFNVVRQYLKKRPCWLRNVLQYQLRIDGFKDQYTVSQLKNILKYLCYTYKDGPWKHIFCRFGFNPTKERQAALYQILIIKIKKKEVEDYDDKSNQQSQIQNDVYDPSFQEMPTKYLRLYQLCDIEDKRIQQLAKSVSLVSQQCVKQTGWFSKYQFSQLQKIIKNIRQQRTRK